MEKVRLNEQRCDYDDGFGIGIGADDCRFGFHGRTMPIIKSVYESSDYERFSFGWVLSHFDVLLVSSMLGVDAEDVRKAFEELKNRSGVTIDGVDVNMDDVEKMERAYMDMVVRYCGGVDEESFDNFVKTFCKTFGVKKGGGDKVVRDYISLGKDDIRRLVEYIDEHRDEIDELQMRRERVDDGSDLYIQGGCGAERKVFDEVVSKFRVGGKEIAEEQELKKAPKKAPKKEKVNDVKRKHR